MRKSLEKVAETFVSFFLPVVEEYTPQPKPVTVSLGFCPYDTIPYHQRRKIRCRPGREKSESEDPMFIFMIIENPLFFLYSFLWGFGMGVKHPECVPHIEELFSEECKRIPLIALRLVCFCAWLLLLWSSGRACS